MSTEIGAVYANALFSLAKDMGDSVMQETRADLRQCAVLFSLHPDLTRLLSLPTLPVSERTDIAKKIFGTEGLACRLLFLLIDHDRVSFLSEIADAFDARMLEYQDTIQVKVTTAVPMTDTQEARLIQALSQKLGKTVWLTKQIDRELLGGMTVQYGDTRLDNSLRTRLNTLKTALTVK